MCNMYDNLTFSDFIFYPHIMKKKINLLLQQIVLRNEGGVN